MRNAVALYALVLVAAVLVAVSAASAIRSDLARIDCALSSIVAPSQTCGGR